MKVIYSDKHNLHDSEYEVSGGLLVKPFERPSRIEYILKRLKERGHSDMEGPNDFGLDPVLKICRRDYIDFLAEGFAAWKKAGYKGDMIATGYMTRRMVDKRPNFIDGQLSYYALSSETSINKGTWEAAQASKDVALTATEKVMKNGQPVFALCRPPGHHATADMFGGYCFLNNAAIAAQYMRDHGAKKVAVLDVDFHHGNGTQDIFYERGDVLFVSLHGQPQDAYPFFLGYEDEKGRGAGLGTTHNFPMPPGTAYGVWGQALATAIKTVQTFSADALVVSLGVDTYEKDPISFFKLINDDFTTMGRTVAGLNLPTVIIMEGGYAIDDIGVNVVNFLEGFSDGAKK